MAAKRKALKVAQRVAVHRKRRHATGLRRIEVMVPAKDVMFLRAVAGHLRDGGGYADRLRDRIIPLLKPVADMTGREFVDALTIAPEFAVDLDIERDKTPLRPIDLG